MSKRLAIELLAAIIFFTPAFTPVFAATSGFIDVFVDTPASRCGDSVLVIESTWSYTENDIDGEDLVAIMAYDASGTMLAADWQGSLPGQDFLRLTAFGGSYSSGEIQSRPITIDLYDLSRRPADGQNTIAVRDSILAQSPPLLERFVYDPAEDVASCKAIPWAVNTGFADDMLTGRRLIFAIPMMMLLVLLPIRQIQRNQHKKP